MNTRELERGMPNIFQLTGQHGEIALHKPEGFKQSELGLDTINTTQEAEEKIFTFDHAYDETSSQVEVYEECAKSIIKNVLEGYNGTIFAYGQTGTGKTYTMTGDPDDFMQKGIMPRAFEDIISILDGGFKVIIKASYLEIYNEEIRDLLSNNPKQRLQLHEKKDTGVYVDKLSMHPIQCIEDLYELLM